MKGLVQVRARAAASYAAQQIGRSHRGEDSNMQYADSEKLAEFDEDALAEILQWVPAEQRVCGLSPEERLAGMTEEEKGKFRDLLERRANGSTDH